jgi:cation diffusion facilitator CzcD-associated flavoprotein CzcO
MPASPSNPAIAIVGAGFSGIGMAIRLKQEGIEDFVILERAARIGGTWRDNSYPGCACDIPSNLYSLSFAPNPSWTRMYSPAGEIWDYLERLVAEYGLERHLRLECELVDGEWDDELAAWRLETSDGPLTANVVISATGLLIEPSLPELPGLDSFQGPAFHSARWDHEADLGGRRVAVIGTGASAIQFIPHLQREAARLTLFQRTAPWVLPKLDRETGAFERRLFARLPLAQRALRGGLYGFAELVGLGLFAQPRLLAPAEALGRRQLARQVPDPGLRAKLTPTFRLGCKRILFSNDYYPALTQGNVDVVTDAIAEVRPQSIVTADGSEHELDAIVYGTGFDFPSGPLYNRLRGRGGVTLAHERGREDIEAHLGTTFAGFPNAFAIVGPNTGLGSNSLLVMIEAQIGYTLDAIKTIRRERLAAVEVRRDAQDSFNARVQRDSQGTVWLAGGCDSWYLNSAGKNTTLWPRSTLAYRWATRRFDAASYDLRPAPLRGETYGRRTTAATSL